MNVSVFGLGYVGCVSVGCLASSGHKVIGFDVDKDKVSKINNGTPTIVEKGISELLENHKNNISATTSVSEAVFGSDVSILCVGTPGSNDGLLDTSYLEKAAADIAKALKTKDSYHTISIRSTVPAGTNLMISKLMEEASGKVLGKDFDVVNNPEFLREGNAVDDYQNPCVTVIGVRDKDSESARQMTKLYSDIPGEIMLVDIQSAEIIKYVNNSWHALKIVFANEVGRVCKQLNIDSNEVMELFCKDTKLNLSSYYFKPGYAFGGPCLPKDLRGFVGLAKNNKVPVKALESLEISNNEHIEYTFDQIKALGKKKIAFLGLSFKSGTDDLRFSTKCKLAKMLYEEGFDLKVHDMHVFESLKSGINSKYIEHELGGLLSLLSDSLDETLDDRELVVYSHHEPYYESLGERLDASQVLFELSKYKGDFKGKRVGVVW